MATESARVAFLTRYGEAFVPKGDSALQDGDQLHLFITRGDVERVERFLAAPPPSESS
jgi:trk system potassium uptake protein TrkA